MDDGRLYLGIDYGGNAVKMGLIDAHGNLSSRQSRPTTELLGKVECRAFAADVAGFVHGSGVYSSELGGVGLAVPGIVNSGAYLTPNVKADWPLVLKCLEQALSKAAISVLNDANAAALGELWTGAGGNARSALLVTLGSGLGSGLIVDGRVVSGGNGAAGEVGHMTVVPGGRPCKCGRRGCVERYASARGIVQSFLEAGEASDLDPARFGSRVPEDETDALAVFDAARAGDPRGERALGEMADKLGFALAQAACVVDPDVILLGGGIAAGADLYLDALRAAYRTYCFEACAATEIRCATLLGDAGVYGAARYAMTSSPRDGAQRDWLDPDFGL